MKDPKRWAMHEYDEAVEVAEQGWRGLMSEHSGWNTTSEPYLAAALFCVAAELRAARILHLAQRAEQVAS